MVNNMIRDEGFDFIITTDGSTFNEKWVSCGMSGAAAVIHGKEITNPALAKLQISLGSESNNYLAELRGINIGLKCVQEVAQPVKVLLFAIANQRWNQVCHGPQSKNTDTLSQTTGGEYKI